MLKIRHFAKPRTVGSNFRTMRPLYCLAIVLCCLSTGGLSAQTHACEDNFIIPQEQREIEGYIAQGNLEKIKAIDPISLKYTNDYGETYLFYAVREDNIDLINYLLKIGLDINHFTKRGESLLHYSTDNLELTGFLIKKGVNTNKQDSDGLSPIMLSAQRGNIDLVRLYIVNNADLSLKDNEGKTVLDYANGMTRIKHEKVFQPIKDLLKTYGATSGYPLREAVVHGTVDEVKEILKSSKSPVDAKDQFGSTALVYTCSVEKLKLLYEYGIDLNIRNQDGLTGLIFAARKDCYDAVKFYVEHGAEINAMQGTKTALDNASSAAIIELLISSGAKKGEE